jgi:predicted exporter
MTARKLRRIGGWLALILLAAAIAAHARYIADLSAFLPARPTPAQRLLVDQLRSGPASRLILIALQGGDAATRARIAASMAARLRTEREFSSVNDGEDATADRDRNFLFEHRYVLSEAVTPQRFTPAGLRSALEETLADLASPEGLLIKSLTPRDPTGETMRVIEQLSRTPTPRSEDGVWISADGARTLLIAETAAAGSDTDGQEHALDAVRAAFASGGRAAGPAARQIELRMSGTGVFSVAARASIQHAVVRLSIAASALIVVVLFTVYRSAVALLLGLLPVATGALIGVAAVALGFGAVHGITLAFGVTLIGESVDYSIYFFIQSHRAPARAGADRQLWPTMVLGMLASVCGFASLLPSGFPGLAQLGVYSICGLIAALGVTRFILPELLPARFQIRDLTPLGVRIASWIAPLRRRRPAVRWGCALALGCAALLVLYCARGRLWNRELSSLSPIPAAALAYDAQLRADLGAPNALDLVVVPAASLESVLRGAERAAQVLAPLVARKIIGGFDSPASYLPSQATQAGRRASLPESAVLRANLEQAAAGLPFDTGRLTPFLQDVEAARHAASLTPEDLRGTSLAAGFDALILHLDGRWNALIPLRAADPSTAGTGAAGTGAAGPGAPDIDIEQVRSAFAAASSGAWVLDMKRESDALYAEYLREAIRLSLYGLAAIAALLWLALRSALRAARVLAPLALSVLTVAAAFALARRELTILHLVGMLLIVAVGSNYALFFDRNGGAGGEDARSPDASPGGALPSSASPGGASPSGASPGGASPAGTSPLTLASLGLANLCTVIGFGLLCFSGVPVLEALGSTVAPGTLLALIFAAALTRADRAPDGAGRDGSDRLAGPLDSKAPAGA